MPRILTLEQLGKERVSGFYETPPLTVEYICRQILPHYRRGSKILDPAVGEGVFLEALLRAGAAVEDLYGFDIDPAKIAALKSRFPQVQVFDATEPFPEQYDFILGNPPYQGDESPFLRAHRLRLKKQFAEVGAKNSYSMITFQAIKALKPGGIFSLLLPDSFLTNSYYRKFRLFLLENTHLREILLAPWKLFHHRAADVRTCILSGERKREAALEAAGPLVRLVDRVAREDQYLCPPRVEWLPQEEFHRYPNAAFLIGLPEQIRRLHLEAEVRLGDIALGGTGISTGNDRRFLRRREEVAGDAAWVPYYKNGARRAYWYEPEYYIERDYQAYGRQIGNYLVRNRRFFFREGISCSSVGVRFSAAYMPPGGLFGVNTNFFIDDRETLFYVLGYLNSKLAWYLARKVLARSNNISANYLRLMPYREPAAKKKAVIARQVEEIVENLRLNPAFDFSPIQARLEREFYRLFSLTSESIAEVEDFCANFYQRL
jgi:adenine-specific DNA-methyltransferase